MKDFITEYGHTKERLKELQALPLERKVGFTSARIVEWYNHFNGKVYVSFSGGKDSTVLLHLVRGLFPDVKAMYVNTGLEYPEIVQFVKTFDNVDIIRPKISFKQVIEKYGYPVVSKEQSQYLEDIQKGTERLKKRRYEGYNGQFKLSKKYYYLADAPFKISNKCCHAMKREPIRKYEKETGRVPFLAIMASESLLRQNIYLKTGCNDYDSKRPRCYPLGFWTDQDIYQYILENNLEICSIYGDIVKDENGKLKPTGCTRSGCIWCCFGVQYDEKPNRFQRLKITHPQIHDYCMNKLGLKQVLEYMGEPYE